ncbi:hypothetical protein [Microbulbifer sp. YPW16]|uniref:hypothetical protein n=1 Tax=Microbulbifer sp. YPW16 TaxID=2904242 RepID=UPI001E425280|nr:hypothetical protein [Microbulbifer sp. YPW16]UHQ56001.1 hypothetical protein LVE68_03180 [Microbulbifer sp. YPW16]
MLQALIAGGVVYGLFNLLERGRDRGLDGFTSITFVLVPALLVWLASMAVAFSGLPQQLLLPLLTLYFVVPALMLRLQFDFSWKTACGYGALVFVVAIAVDILLGIGLAAIGN